LLVEDLCEVVGEGGIGTAKTEKVLFEAFIVAVEDCKWRSQFEEVMGVEVGLGVLMSVLIQLVVQP